MIAWLGSHAGLDPGAMSLAAFHTFFIALGVVIFLQLVPRFAALVERLLAERGENLTQRLDDSMLAIPAVALEASERALGQTATRLLQAYSDLLKGRSEELAAGRLQEFRRSLDTAYAFVSGIKLLPDDHASASQRIAKLHAIDHLLRFRTRLEDLVRAGIDLSAPAYGWALSHNLQILELARHGLQEQRLADMLPELELNALGLTELSRQMRHELLDDETAQSGNAADTLTKADAYRWLERTGHHIWRISHYLAKGRPLRSKQPSTATA